MVLFQSKSSKIPQTKVVKYLGFQLDRRLIWKTHITRKRAQVNPRLKKSQSSLLNEPCPLDILALFTQNLTDGWLPQWVSLTSPRHIMMDHFSPILVGIWWVSWQISGTNTTAKETSPPQSSGHTSLQYLYPGCDTQEGRSCKGRQRNEAQRWPAVGSTTRKHKPPESED